MRGLKYKCARCNFFFSSPAALKKHYQAKIHNNLKMGDDKIKKTIKDYDIPFSK